MLVFLRFLPDCFHNIITMYTCFYWNRVIGQQLWLSANRCY